MAARRRRAQETFGPQLLQRGAGHAPWAATLASGTPVAFEHEGNGAAGPGVGLDDEHLILLDGELDVDEALDVERVGNGSGVALDDVDHAA